GRFGVPSTLNGNCWDGYGNYFIPGTTPVANPPQSDAFAFNQPMPNSLIRFGDLNGDGMSDYALLDGNGLSVCIRYGGYSDTAHFRCHTDSTLAGSDQTQVGKPTANILIGDVDGTGINQVIYFPAPASFRGAPGDATAVRAR